MRGNAGTLDAKRLVISGAKAGVRKKGQTVNRAERNSPRPGSGGRAVGRMQTSAARLHRSHSGTSSHCSIVRRDAGNWATVSAVVITLGAPASALQPTCFVRQARRPMSASCGRSVHANTRAALALHNSAVAQCAGCPSCAMHELCKASCVTMRKPVAQPVGSRRTSVAGPVQGAFQHKGRQISTSSLSQAHAGH